MTLLLLRFLYTDLSSNKRRPAIVLAVRAGYSDVILAFISSVLPSVFDSYDLPLLRSDPDFLQTGLKVSSVIRLNKLATLDRQLVTRRIGHLSTQRLQVVDAKLVTALGIDVTPYYIQERQRLTEFLNKHGVEALLSALQR